MITLVLLGFTLASTALIREVRKAPEGYEDQNGFHVIPSQPAPRKVILSKVTSKGGFFERNFPFLQRHARVGRPVFHSLTPRT